MQNRVFSEIPEGQQQGRCTVGKKEDLEDEEDERTTSIRTVDEKKQ